MKNHLVILGGMGPQASIHLHQLIIEKAAARLSGFNDYPCILHVSLAVPDTIASDDAEDATVLMFDSVCAELPMENAAAVCIACNTAHLFVDKMQKLPKERFVSMIEAVANDAASAGAHKVGLLGSPLTIQSGLYQDALAARGIEVVTPDATDVNRLNNVIHEVVYGVDPPQLRPVLNEIAGKLEQNGADAILLGCTELPLVGVDGPFTVLDSLDSLARAMLARWEHD